MKYYLESLRWLRKRERMRKAKGGSKYISVEKTLRAKWANRCGGLWRRFCVRNWQTAAACGEDFAREMGKLLLRPVKEILHAKLANCCCGLRRRLCARNGQTAASSCRTYPHLPFLCFFPLSLPHFALASQGKFRGTQRPFSVKYLLGEAKIV